VYFHFMKNDVFFTYTQPNWQVFLDTTLLISLTALGYMGLEGIPSSIKFFDKNLFIPISLIELSTLYAEKMAKYKAFILITRCYNY